jgi:hypothetical protein
MKEKIKFIFLLMIFSTTYCMIQYNQFRMLTKDTYTKENGEVNFCFKNLRNNFNFLSITDEFTSIDGDLNKDIAYLFPFEALNDSIAYSDNTKYWQLKGIYVQDFNSYFYKSEKYNLIDFDTIYCLKIFLVKETSNLNLKRLKLEATTSTLFGRLVRDSLNLGRVDLYNLSDQAIKIDSDYVLTPDSNLIYNNTKFSLQTYVSITLPEGKRIPTKDDQIMIIFRFKGNLDLSSMTVLSNIDNTNVNETKLFNSKITILDNTVTITDFDEEFFNMRKFPLMFEGIQIKGDTTVSIESLMLWKNTNSVISKHVLEILTTVKYVIKDAVIENSNKVPSIYNKASWPFVFKFETPIVLVKDSIILKATRVHFIASTCNFASIPNSSESFCVSISNNEIEFRNISSSANTILEIGFWIYADTPGSPTFEVVIKNKTQVANVNTNFLNIFSGFQNVKNSFTSSNLCMAGSQTNCENRLIVNENSGNFFLIENNSLGLIDVSNSSSPVKFQDLISNQTSNNFRIRFRYDFTNSKDVSDLSLYSEAFAGEWTKFSSFQTSNDIRTYSLIDINSIIKGRHNFYFPSYSKITNTKECRVLWGSSLSLRTNLNEHPNYSNVIKLGNDFNIYNNYKIIPGNSSLVSGNRISFDNYNNIGDINTGLFFNLIFSNVCNQPDQSDITTNCTNNNNPDDLKLTWANFEISSNCVSFQESIKITSIFQEFDFIHFFAVKNTSTFIRANRFVSLLPQPGIFSLVQHNLTGGSLNSFITNTFIVNSINYDIPCLLRLNFSESTNFYISRPDDNRLIAFLNGLEFLNIEENTPSRYQINVNLGLNVFNSLPSMQTRFYNGIYSILSEESTKLVETRYFSNTFYTDYLSSIAVFNSISTSKLTKETIMLPIKCTKSSNLEYFILFTDVKFGNGIYTHQYSYNESNYIFRYFPNNKFVENAKIVLANNNNFPNFNSQRLIINSETYAENFIKDKFSYIALLIEGPSSINLNNILLYNKEGILIENSFYDKMLQTKIFINNQNFSHAIFICFKVSNSFFSGISISTSSSIQFEGISNFYPVDNAKMSITIGGSENEIISNFSNSQYIYSNPSKTTVNNPIDVKITVNFVDTSNLRLGTNKNIACVKVTTSLPQNISKIDLYSPNIRSYTIAGDSNKQLSFTNVSGSYLEIVGLNGSNNFFICNFDLETYLSFKIEKIVTLYKNSSVENTEYIFSPNIESKFTVNSNAYNGYFVENYDFSTNQNTFSKLTFTLNSDYSVYSNMVMIIQSDLNSIRISTNLIPQCSIFFELENENSLDNTFFSSCNIDFTNKIISITTLNEIVLYKIISKRFYISLYPVYATNLENTVVKISSTHRVEESKISFPQRELNLQSKTMNNSINIINVTKNTKIIEIFPSIPDEFGFIEIEFDFNANSDIRDYFNKNENLKLNEMRLIFNKNFYELTDRIGCLINNSRVYSCYRDKNDLKIIHFIPYGQIIRLKLFGFKVPHLDKKEVAQSLILFQFLNTVGNTSLVLIHGQVELSTTLDKNTFSHSGIINGNIVVYEQNIINNFPNNSSTLELKISFDLLTGINSLNPITELNDTFFYFYLPKEIDANIETQIIISELKPLREDPENIVTYSISPPTILPDMIYTRINTSTKINNSFRHLQITISNINLFQKEAVTDILEITIFKRNGFIFKTLPLLLTQNNKENKLNEIKYGYFTNLRGMTIKYNDEKYYFSLDHELNIKKGTYKPINVEVKHNIQKSKNYSTSVILTDNVSLNYQTNEPEYYFDGRFNSKKTIYLGIKCDIISGKLIAKMISSNKDNFFEFPLLILYINDLEKEKILLYSDIDTPYNQPSNTIFLSRGGFTYFWMMPLTPNMDQISISLLPDLNLGTEISPKFSTFVMEKFTIKKTPFKFELISSIIDKKQTYTIKTDNNCYVTDINSISFHANTALINSIPLNFSIKPLMTYNNSTTTTNPKSTTVSELNTIKLLITPTRTIDFILNSNIFCTLYCEDIREPSNTILNLIPHPDDTWYSKWYYSKLVPGKTLNLNFDNLYRNVNYNLKCIVETSDSNPIQRKNVTEIVTFINQKRLSPKEISPLGCVVFELLNPNTEFLLSALTVLQDKFYFENYFQKGCVTAISNEGIFLEKYNPLMTTCKSLNLNLNTSNSTNSTNSTNSNNTDENIFLNETQSSSIIENNSTVTTNKIGSLRYLKSRFLNTTTSSNNQINPSNEITICFVTKQDCPSDISITEFNKILSDFLAVKETSGQKSSLFLDSLFSDLKTYYSKHTITTIDNSIIFPRINFINLSDFKSSNTTALVKFKLNLNSQFSKELLCFWNLVENNENLIQTVDTILKCNLQTEILCGNNKGIPIPSDISLEVKISKFRRNSTYEINLTCKENLIIADKFKNLYIEQYIIYLFLLFINYSKW